MVLPAPMHRELMQGGKHTTSRGGTVYVLTSGPALAVHQTPAARLFAWAITNTSALAQAVGSRSILSACTCQEYHKSSCHDLPCHHLASRYSLQHQIHA